MRCAVCGVFHPRRRCPCLRKGVQSSTSYCILHQVYPITSRASDYDGHNLPRIHTYSHVRAIVRPSAYFLSPSGCVFLIMHVPLDADTPPARAGTATARPPRRTVWLVLPRVTPLCGCRWCGRVRVWTRWWARTTGLTSPSSLPGSSR